MVRIIIRFLFTLAFAAFLSAQTDSGELRLHIVDAAGLAVQAEVRLRSEANHVDRTLTTDPQGNATAKHLPFGPYHVTVTRAGFAPLSELIDIRSALPLNRTLTLGVAPVQTEVVVRDAQTLLDPHSAAAADRIGHDALEHRPTSLPGRSVIDLINMQPGWLLEANGILHPRGSEYQTQYVVDGVPLVDNRSPAFAPEIEAEDVQSISVLTGDYPAEYGRKLGGVIEVVTSRDSRQGLHGKVVANGGSFDTAGAYATLQYGWGRNTVSLSGDASRTDRYLDPPVEQNYTNSGTTGNFMTRFERDFSDRDRLSLVLRRDQARFLVPNEQEQQQAGQRQDRNTFETVGQFSYQHIFSANVLGDLYGVARDLTAGLWSNPLSTPIIAGQDRGFRESYLKGTVSVHHGIHELKFGGEGDFGSLRETFAYRITDPSQFDPDTPPAFNFFARAQDREQSAFAQDLIRFGRWTVSAGLRYDHYRLVVDENAVSPRLGAAWYWPGAGIVFRASYDRVFQTPAFENLLLASSEAVTALSDNVLRLPVRPSLGNYYEAGLSKAFFGKIRLDANYFRRGVDNFADDDLLLNTGVSFPIAFRKAEIHGIEAKLEIPRWGRTSGFVSYSNMNGTGYLPVTGGLFLGDEVAASLNARNSFPVTQDQRNTVRTRFRHEFTRRVWGAAGAEYGSGLPVEFQGTREDALAEYGPRIVDGVNFSRGRVRPNFSFDISAGADLWKGDRRGLRLQADVLNLTNRLNVIDFAGLFSGTALGAPRTVAVRLEADF